MSPRSSSNPLLAAATEPIVESQLQLQDFSQLFIRKLFIGTGRQELLAAENSLMGRQLIADSGRRERRACLLPASAAKLAEGIQQPLNGVVLLLGFSGSR